MSTPEIREAVKDFVHTVEIGEMGAVVMRQADALEAVLGILREVADLSSHEAAPGYAHGFVAGQQKLAGRLLAAIHREMTA